MEMDIRIITLRTENWDEMVAYYRDRVGLVQKFADPKSQYAMFETGVVRLAIEGTFKPAFARRPGIGALMANFQVTNLADAVKNLAQHGVAMLTEIRHGPDYDYVAFADPEGNEHIMYERQRRPAGP